MDVMCPSINGFATKKVKTDRGTIGTSVRVNVHYVGLTCNWDMHLHYE